MAYKKPIKNEFQGQVEPEIKTEKISCKKATEVAKLRGRSLRINGKLVVNGVGPTINLKCE